jgi:hypothetical protein
MDKSIGNKQLAANRRNAAKSTGPKTAEGKAIVARNAMTHGLRAEHVLIEGESEEEFERFREAMIAFYEPVEVLEESLVAKIVVGFWRQWRASRIENEIMYCLGEEPAESKAGQLPFRMVITKTYEGGRHEVVEAGGSPPEDEPERVEPRRRRTLGEAVIASLEGAGILNKFIRYEAHIDRMLSRSIRELERVQEKRKRAESRLTANSQSLTANCQ